MNLLRENFKEEYPGDGLEKTNPSTEDRKIEFLPRRAKKKVITNFCSYIPLLQILTIPLFVDVPDGSTAFNDLTCSMEWKS